MVSDEILLQCIIEASDCIEKISSRFIISGGENIAKYANRVDILLNHHRYKGKTLKERILDLKISEDFYKIKILDESLNSLKNKTSKTSKFFNTKIEEYESKNLSTDEKDWYFVFPMNFNLKCRGKAVLQEFEIYNKKLKLINYYNFKKSEFWTDNINRILKSQFYDNKNLNKYSWLVINEVGKEPMFAFEQSIKILNKFLGAINLSFWLNRYKGIEYSPYTEVKGYTNIVSPSYVLRYNNNKKYENSHPIEKGQIVYKFEEFRDDIFDAYGELVKTFEDLNNLDKESEVYSTIFEALDIYHSALNKFSLDSGFLDFWTGIEKMTFRRRKGRDRDLPYPKMVDRIIGILINPSEIIKIKITENLDKRHSLVHDGKYNIISLSDFNFIRNIYEKVLFFLISYNNEFKKIDEIEMFYDIAGKSKNQLQDEIKIRTYMLQEKDKYLQLSTIARI